MAEKSIVEKKDIVEKPQTSKPSRKQIEKELDNAQRALREENRKNRLSREEIDRLLEEQENLQQNPKIRVATATGRRLKALHEEYMRIKNLET